MRIDKLLVEEGYYESREKAQQAISAGEVEVEGKICLKSASQVSSKARINIRNDRLPYVGRGGLKLEAAIKRFGLNLYHNICADIGASTGGFTDCMLQNGASKVFAIDVGYGQLAWKLRNDKRVVNIEKTNVRYFDPAGIEAVDFISIDVSFISLGLILPVASRMLKDEGELVCLIKPQFEAERSDVGKNGIVRDEKVHEKVIEKVINFSEEFHLLPQDITNSPIFGAKGNAEFLIYFKKSAQSDALNIRKRMDELKRSDIIKSVVKRAQIIN